MVKAVFATALAGLCWLFRRAEGREERAALWPFALALLALVGPIGWSYYYLSAAAFVPLLVARLGIAYGSALIVMLIFGTSPFFAPQRLASAESAIHYIRVCQSVGLRYLSIPTHPP